MINLLFNIKGKKDRTFTLLQVLSSNVEKSITILGVGSENWCRNFFYIAICDTEIFFNFLWIIDGSIPRKNVPKGI
jgi:hypothetical protein